MSVKAWETVVTIPTYKAAEADKNPMFLEKRVYQGSSGRVYPHPVCENISNEKTEVEYKAVFLENDYLQVMILPELGGRIQRALDKTNNYDFVYYNHVIKPALVGLAGPWISGGIEFNWPQHHRPSTFDPVDYTITENDDGSATVWVSEIEKIYHTKGMAGFTLYPDKAYIEIKGQLYNPTERTQTFLWWSNPAVPVNDYTKSIFPPDVYAVMDHGKRDVSKFPIATGTYYKMDYSKGVDISMYKNIPVPTSYMAYHSDYDFIGNYDFSKEAGLLHVADHHINPGKKQWTWGCGDFGKAWDRNLTDDDGPYIELMTGIFTDNQPDFTFIAPYEEKTFTQYFMPYKSVGAVKNATINAVVNMEISDNKADICVYTTSEYNNARIKVFSKNKIYFEENAVISPNKVFKASCYVDSEYPTICVYDEIGNILVSYTPLKKEIEKIPEPAKPALMPEEIKTCEELYLTAVHLEQYHHATYSPDPYYLEGLKRDSGDIRLNNGYGKLLYNRGMFAEAEKYFRKSVERSIWKNPNPYDSEPYYNLGLTLKMLGKTQGAYDAFYKAAWSGAMQDKAFYQLALIEENISLALEFVEKSLIRNSHNLKARNLKTSLLRICGDKVSAESFAKETVSIDPLDFGSRYELFLITGDNKYSDELDSLMRGDPHNYIELALNYMSFGDYTEAKDVLDMYKGSDALLSYYAAYCAKDRGLLKKAGECDTKYCFPNRLDDIAVLEYAIENNPNDYKAPYYLANLYYDRTVYDKAQRLWEKSCAIYDKFPTVHRNLSLLYFNKLGDSGKALKAMETAFELDKTDARVFMELDQLYKRLNYTIADRIANYHANIELIEKRDDLYTEYVTLVNLTGEYEKALELTMKHIFHPWEGGEGKITAQYRNAHIAIAKKDMEKGSCKSAEEHLKAALEYPYNLGEGKLAGAMDNDIHYLLGCVYEKCGRDNESRREFMLAARGGDGLSSAMYYNDQPPEMYFYRALAEQKLGNNDGATGKFNRLIDYGEKHIFDNVKIDYFAVSLPDFLIYEGDLNEKNYVHCCYMMALGHLGAGEREKSRYYFEEAHRKEYSHQGVAVHMELLDKTF